MDDIIVIKGIIAEDDGEKLVTVDNAAKYLTYRDKDGEVRELTARRVRAIINPVCYCALERRKKNLEGGKPDCRLCGGSGKPAPRLASIRVGKQFFIRRDDLIAYNKTRKITV
jgi:hypothetical protein